MIPYSATDLVRAVRHAHGLPEEDAIATDSPSRVWRWLAAIFHRA